MSEATTGVAHAKARVSTIPKLSPPSDGATSALALRSSSVNRSCERKPRTSIPSTGVRSFAINNRTASGSAPITRNTAPVRLRISGQARSRIGRPFRPSCRPTNRTRCSRPDGSASGGISTPFGITSYGAGEYRLADAAARSETAMRASIRSRRNPQRRIPGFDQPSSPDAWNVATTGQRAIVNVAMQIVGVNGSWRCKTSNCSRSSACLIRHTDRGPRMMFGSDLLAGTIAERPTEMTSGGGGPARPTRGWSARVNCPGGSLPMIVRVSIPSSRSAAACSSACSTTAPQKDQEYGTTIPTFTPGPYPARLLLRHCLGDRLGGLVAPHRRQRQVEQERRPLALLRRDRHAALHPTRQLSADVEPEPRAAHAAAEVRIDAVELPEDPLQLAVRDPEALVADREPKSALPRLDADLDPPALGRVLHGVVDEVEEDLPDLVRIADDRGEPAGLRHGERDVVSCSQRGAHLLDHLDDEPLGVDVLLLEPQPAGVELVRQQDVPDDPRQPLALERDHFQQPVRRRHVEVDVAPAQRLRAAVDRRERRPQLVRDGGDELALQGVERALLGQVAERVDDAIVELHARDADPELAGGELQRHRRITRGRPGLRRHRYPVHELVPAWEHLRDPPPEDVDDAEPGDRLRGRVPVLDRAWAVDEEDTVVDVVEQPGVLLEQGPLFGHLPVEPAHPDRPLQRRQEVVAIDRLLDEVERAAAERLDGEVVLAVAGDQQHGRPGPELPGLVQQREAVHPGHLDVADDRVVVDRADPVERGHRAVGRVDVDVRHPELQRLRERLEQRLVVVDEQDPGLVGHRIGASAGRSPPRGSSILNVAPLPGFDANEISPPCSLTMLYVIERPRPVPEPTSLVVKNGSKTRDSTSGGIPGPVSANVM